VDEERKEAQDHHYCYLLMRLLMLVDVVAMQWTKKGRWFRIITTVTNQNAC